jgi:hypothetical protein
MKIRHLILGEFTGSKENVAKSKRGGLNGERVPQVL